MLSIPHNGIDVLSAPSPAADVPEVSKLRQLMYITLNNEILAQITAANGKGMSVTFGGTNAGLKVGDKVHKFSGVTPEAAGSPLEIYRTKTASSKPKLDLLGRVSHKIQVRRGLDISSMERIKHRTEEAERERNSRKAVFLEKPPSAKRTPSAHARNHSGSSRSFLSVFENKPGVKGSGVRSLPSSPLLRPNNGVSTPKYLPIGGSPRIAPISSPRLNPSSPKPSGTPLRLRLIHLLALGPNTEHSLQEKTRSLNTELKTCLQDIARKVTPGSLSWELKDESYRELKPKEWKSYTTQEREIVEKKLAKVLARLPPVDKVLPIQEIPRKRAASGGNEDYARSVAVTPKTIDSPVPDTPPTIPAKRPAEEEAVNPVRKVGGAIISTKKKPTKASKETTPKEKVAVKAPATGKPRAKPSAQKKSNNPNIKSAEKVVDSNSESDSDIPLQKQVKQQTKSKTEVPLTGLGISAAEPERKHSQVISPPASQSYRSRTSSSSSNASYSPPKKRSPLATNEPITAQREARPPSPPPSAKKRARDEDDTKSVDKRQKLVTEKPKVQKTQKRKSDDTVVPPAKKRESTDRKIGKEYHDLAERFRQLYPEYQQLHRRLQGLDNDRLAREKNNVDKLCQMQEQLEKWKAVLWKAAGETRRVGTERTSGMVGVRV